MKTKAQSGSSRCLAFILAVVLLFPTGFCLPFFGSKNLHSTSDRADHADGAASVRPSPEGSVRKPVDNPAAGSAAIWPAPRSGPGEFLRFCLDGCDTDPDSFADALRSHFKELTVQEIEAAVWALSRTRPGLAADIAAGSKNPWLCVRLAESIAAGVPSGDKAMLDGIMRTLRLPASARARLTASALADRAERDPAWALGQIHGDNSLRSQFNVLKGLARTDPQKALQESAARRLNPVGMAAVFLEIAKTQPAGILQIVDSQSDPAAGAAFLTRLLRDNPHQLNSEESKTVSTLVDRYADTSLSGPNQGTVIRADLVRNLLTENPAEAVAQFEKVPDRQRAGLMTGVALTANNQNWTDALNWVRTTQDDGSISERQLYGVFVNDWARADPEGLERALLRDKNMPARGLLLDTLKIHYQQKGGEAYAIWARNLPQDLKTRLN